MYVLYIYLLYMYSYHSYKSIIKSILIVEESFENQVYDRTEGTTGHTPPQWQRHHSIGDKHYEQDMPNGSTRY